jgi:hypothetical protein
MVRAMVEKDTGISIEIQLKRTILCSSSSDGFIKKVKINKNEKYIGGKK